jgi:hypothetical protein
MNWQPSLPAQVFNVLLVCLFVGGKLTFAKARFAENIIV